MFSIGKVVFVGLVATSSSYRTHGTHTLSSSFPEGTLVLHNKLNCDGVVVAGKAKNKVCYMITGGSGKKCAKMANGKAKCIGAKAVPKQLSVKTTTTTTTTTTKAPYTYSGPLYGVSDQRKGQPVHIVHDGRKCEGTITDIKGGICAACDDEGKEMCFSWKEGGAALFQTPEVNAVGCDYQYKYDFGGCEMPTRPIMKSGACKEWCQKEFR